MGGHVRRRERVPPHGGLPLAMAGRGRGSVPEGRYAEVAPAYMYTVSHTHSQSCMLGSTS